MSCCVSSPVVHHVREDQARAHDHRVDTTSEWRRVFFGAGYSLNALEPRYPFFRKSAVETPVGLANIRTNERNSVKFVHIVQLTLGGGSWTRRDGVDTERRRGRERYACLRTSFKPWSRMPTMRVVANTARELWPHHVYAGSECAQTGEARRGRGGAREEQLSREHNKYLKVVPRSIHGPTVLINALLASTSTGLCASSLSLSLVPLLPPPPTGHQLLQ